MGNPASHPLIEELKSDLDVAFDHFKRTTEQLSKAKRDGVDQSMIVLKRSELGVCFDLLQTAGERFGLLNDLYATVVAAPDRDTAIEAIAAQVDLVNTNSVSWQGSAERFVSALSEFLDGNNLSDSNHAFRKAWLELEVELLGGSEEPVTELRAAQR